MINLKKRYKFRKDRVRQKISGTAERPRLSVYKSLKHIYAQVIDDTAGKTLVSASSMAMESKGKKKSAANIVSAEEVGKAIAQQALSKNVKRVVFDRGGRVYHGVVKALADAARKSGLEF